MTCETVEEPRFLFIIEMDAFATATLLGQLRHRGRRRPARGRRPCRQGLQG
jgi:hypothetical protein